MGSNFYSHGFIVHRIFEYALCIFLCITKTCLLKHTENFTIKIWKFSNKKFWYFHISAQNIDCGYSLEPPRRGGSNEYPQSMFLSRNKKNNVYPCKPQFYYIKVGFKGVKTIKVCFRDWLAIKRSKNNSCKKVFRGNLLNFYFTSLQLC